MKIDELRHHETDCKTKEEAERSTKEALINWLHERITSLRGTHAFTHLVDMSQLLRSGRLALYLVH
jgi:hypothetical protein